MISSDDDGIIVLSQLLEEVGQHTMSEPAEGDAAERTFVIGQFTHHLRFSAGMTEHVDEVHNKYVQVVDMQVIELLQETVASNGIIDLVVRERVFPTVTVELCLNERTFIEVLPLFFILIHPQVGKEFCNLVGHQSAEDGVTGILRSSRQDAHIQMFLDVELVANLL